MANTAKKSQTGKRQNQERTLGRGQRGRTYRHGNVLFYGLTGGKVNILSPVMVAGVLKQQGVLSSRYVREVKRCVSAEDVVHIHICARRRKRRYRGIRSVPPGSGRR